MEQDEGWTLVKRSNEYADIKYSAIERHLLFQVEVVKMTEYISFCFLIIGKLELVEIFLNFNEEMTSSSFGELDFNARLMNSIIHLQFLSNFYLSVNRNFNVTNKIANTFNLKMVYISHYTKNFLNWLLAE